MSKANALVDAATHLCLLASNVEQARQSHAIHHQNSSYLRKQFHLTREVARQIIKSCPTCPQFFHVPHYGINPRGLIPNQIWQMDVTHIPEFGKLKYVHVTVDTFSGFIFASALTGEATKHVIDHCLRCFAAIGCPQILKTDNGSGYTSAAFKTFCSQLHIEHKTGIPYNPQGQGIVERAHGFLKTQLEKIKKGELYPYSPQNFLNHALFILNFLNLDAKGHSAAERLWHPTTTFNYATARWKDPLTGQWNGPDPVLIWGRGHVCVFPQGADGARWLPERLVQHAENEHRDYSSDGNTD